MALLGLKVEGGPYRNLQRAAKPAREEEKKETEAPVEQNSSSKRPTGLWDVVNRRREKTDSYERRWEVLG